MLPSEKAERWVRRVGYAALILIAFYVLVWVVRFIWGNYRKALEQRQAPIAYQFTSSGLRLTACGGRDKPTADWERPSLGG